ncbi:MAG: transglutaminase family protein [Herminiimonas sp.]|jgi:transglutaminase-like putative cysteine protease|nr:transglutaminase family protein [Herminiimonas sp.]
MILTIRHETVYRYTTPPVYTIQQLRLWPRLEAHQNVLNWHIGASGHCNAFTDAFGNLCHMLTLTGRHDEVRITANGVVEVTPLERGRLHERGDLSPLVFTVPTRLTTPADTIADFAARHLNGNRTADFLALANAICGAVSYQTGATEVSSTAADALLLGNGVCQDHAHLFLACCHTRQLPARYVSGYIDPGDTSHAQTHAWVDVWVEEVDFSGWISIDVTHSRLQDDAYCRLAVGRDYESAAPVRGTRRGGRDETLAVRVNMSAG